jgi:hypothetical protein
MLTSALACGLVVLGCDRSDQPAAAGPPTTEDLIIADAAAARNALEAYAAEHDGDYPTAHYDFYAFRDALDLNNRYGGTPAVVRDDALRPGEIGIFLYANIEGPADAVGYRVSAMGRDGLLVSYENNSRLNEESVAFYNIMRMHRDQLIAAATYFFAEAGRYPEHTADTTPSGNTLIDFLPDGQLFLNPTNGKYDSPVDGAPGDLGELGYTPNGSACEFVTYTIEIYTPIFYSHQRIWPSADETDISIQRSFVVCAVDEFHNETGRYPADVDTDTDLDGKTIRDRMSRPANIYTGAAVPSNGLATTRGDVGYEPIYEGEDIVGYTVNAWGLFEELDHQVHMP